MRAIADAIEEELAKQGIKPRGTEGRDFCNWVLLDYADVVVHVFERETRDYYSLERLWLDAEVTRFEEDEDTARLGRQDKRAVYS